MKHLSLLCLIIICLSHGRMSAQCDNTLVDRAISQSGAKAVYLREFKVKFDGTESGKVIPTAKYPILLSKNTNYRFNVCNANESEGKVILQLYLKDKLVGSTYDTQSSTDLQRFDFSCNKAATYEIVMSFDEGKPGCAVGILSMLSGNVAESKDEELDILYAQADNPLFIFDDEDEFAEIDITIDNGTINKVDGTNYIVHPKESGTALLTIRVLNSDGTLREFKQKRYAVLALDKPYVSIKGMRGNSLNKQDLEQIKRLELWFSEDIKCNYRIVSFTLSDSEDLISGVSSNSAQFSKSQRDWLNNQPSGIQLYIKNIQVKTADNVVVDIEPMKFYVE